MEGDVPRVPWITWSAGLIAGTTESDQVGSALSAIVVGSAERLQLTELEPFVAGDTIAIHDRDNVIGDRCSNGFAFGCTHHTTRLHTQLMLGAQAMLGEAVPTARIYGVWVWSRSRH